MAANATEILKSIKPEDIDTRLREIDAERESLLVLKRAMNARNRGRKNPPAGADA